MLKPLPDKGVPGRDVMALARHYGCVIVGRTSYALVSGPGGAEWRPVGLEYVVRGTMPPLPPHVYDPDEADRTRLVADALADALPDAYRGRFHWRHIVFAPRSRKEVTS